MLSYDYAQMILHVRVQGARKGEMIILSHDCSQISGYLWGVLGGSWRFLKERFVGSFNGR